MSVGKCLIHYSQIKNNKTVLSFYYFNDSLFFFDIGIFVVTTSRF